MKRNRLITGFIIITVCVLSLVLMKSYDLFAGDDSTFPEVSVKMDSQGKLMPIELPTVDTEEKFNKLVEEYDYTKNHWNWRSFDMLGGMKTADVAVSKAESTGSSNPSVAQSSTSGDYSTTNIQVQGVDEADIIKTDGKNIYQVGDKRVNIISALPAENMELLSTIDFSKENLNVLELYIDESRLTILVSGWNVLNTVETQNVESTSKRISIARPYFQNSYVKALIYDISDIRNPSLLKETMVDGDYVSSRKIDSIVYVTTNKNLDFQLWHKNGEEALPSFMDSSTGEGLKNITLDNIRYFPEISEPNFLNIISFDTLDTEKAANIQSFLGAGRTMYSSAKNLYVVSNTRENKSNIMKFALDNINVCPVANAEVDGYLINQFSMDENNGYFRVATNNHDANALYVLDETLALKGKIENIAPSERIYSVRFMGDRAYMVTFKNTDPLFAIDLKDPSNPQIMGQLKIPGFSNYLHPYDENHIIGFGKDTVEIERKDGNGNLTGGSTAYTLGMKISVFDVTDIKNPKELFVEKIGDRGTESLLLQDQKALLFNKEKEIMAFPINVNQVLNPTKDSYYGMPQYGTPVFQGAYAYNFNIDTGFSLKGKITNMSNEDILKSGYGYNNKSQIKRIIYIGDTLYSISDGMIKASRMSDLKELGSLNLPTK